MVFFLRPTVQTVSFKDGASVHPTFIQSGLEGAHAQCTRYNIIYTGLGRSAVDQRRTLYIIYTVAISICFFFLYGYLNIILYLHGIVVFFFKFLLESIFFFIPSTYLQTI